MRLGLGPYPGTPIKARGVVHSEEKMLSWRKTSQETKQRKKRTKVWRADAQRRIRGQAGARRWAATVRNFSRTMGSMPARLERPFHPSIVVVRYYCIGRCCESSRSVRVGDGRIVGGRPGRARAPSNEMANGLHRAGDGGGTRPKRGRHRSVLDVLGPWRLHPGEAD